VRVCIRASIGLSGLDVTYNQGYPTINADKETNFINEKDSSKLIKPYLTQFKQIKSQSGSTIKAGGWQNRKSFYLPRLHE
jgi:hypothetical protein